MKGLSHTSTEGKKMKKDIDAFNQAVKWGKTKTEGSVRLVNPTFGTQATDFDKPHYFSDNGYSEKQIEDVIGL